VVLLLFSGGCSASEAKRAAEDGAKLYDAGDYDAALPLLEKAAELGLKEGELFYQLGYIYDLKSMAEKSRSFREKAVPLLEKRTASGHAPVEAWYYLTALYAGQNREEEMRKTAQKAVSRYAESPDLSGEDLFRMGRLCQFAGEGGKAATAYHSAVEKFEKEPKPNATLFALALLADARKDYESHRFADAARKFSEAARLSPRSAPSRYETALAHLGAGDLARAQSDFGEVREENLITEAQYGADLARHLGSVGGMTTETLEGKALREMDNATLESAMKSASESLRKAREGRSGRSESEEKLRATERHFFSLVGEWMLRGNELREVALSGGYADLIRR
jgi:tetratricopeptide (TPR) repeat protein